MTGRALQAEFERQGVPAGRAMVFNEDTAVMLVNRAEDEYVAVASVEAIPKKDVPVYQAPRGYSMKDVERLRSWSNARAFVEDLSGRDVYFDVVFEPSWATYVARFRYLARTGAAWSRRGDGEGMR
jgi:hypothetical protein